MVKLKLSIRLESDNLDEISPDPEDFEFTMKISCTSCREEHANEVTMNHKEEHELSGSRGSASFVWRCPQCKKEHSASFIPPTSSSKSLVAAYHPTSASPTYQPLIALDCRGLEPTAFVFAAGRGGQWRAVAAASDDGAKTKPAGFEFELDEDGRWDEYDEVNGREIGVREIEYKWERL